MFYEISDFIRAWLHREFQPGLNFSPFCRCLAYAVKSLIKNIYDYMKKISARVAEVKFQPGQGRPGSRLNGLKISDVIVFSPGWKFQPGWKCHAHTSLTCLLSLHKRKWRLLEAHQNWTCLKPQIKAVNKDLNGTMATKSITCWRHFRITELWKYYGV